MCLRSTDERAGEQESIAVFLSVVISLITNAIRPFDYADAKTNIFAVAVVTSGVCLRVTAQSTSGPQ